MSLKNLKLTRAHQLTFLIFGLLAYTLLHLKTLHLPAVLGDEVAFADNAFHGSQTIWDSLVPTDIRSSHVYYGMGLIPAYIKSLGWVLRSLDVGVVQARLISLLGGLFQLGILLILAWRYRFDKGAWIGLALYAFFPLYLNAMHVTRPDLPVFAASALTFAWLLLSGGTWTGYGVGLCASLAIFFHPEGVFLFVVVPLFIGFREGWKSLLQRRYLAWVIGAVTGAMIGLHYVDIEQGMAYATFTKGVAVRSPAIVQCFSNPLGGISTALRLLISAFDATRTANLIIASLLLSTLGCLLRRYKELRGWPRDILLIGTLYSLVYAFFTPSPTSTYILVFCPWWFIQCGWFAGQLLQRKFILDRFDAWVWTGASLLAFAHMGRVLASTSFALWMSLWIGILLLRLETRWKARAWGSFILGTLVVGYFDSFIIAFLWARYQYLHQPFFFGSVVLIGTLILIWPQRTLAFVSFQKRLPRLLLFYATASILWCLTLSGTQFIQLWQESRQAPYATFSYLPVGASVIGPDSLWLYRPDLQLHGTNSMIFLQRQAPQTAITENLRQVQAHWFIWNGGTSSEDFRWFTSQFDRAGIRYSSEGVQTSPVGALRVFRLETGH